VYDDLRIRLRDELGSAPGAELRSLHQLLLGPGLGATGRAGVRGQSLA
jgi:Bacterial transcriptional activator domain